jgi:hypothetical protein
MMARETGLEPATSGVTGRRSNQLSYSPAGGQSDKLGVPPSQGSQAVANSWMQTPTSAPAYKGQNWLVANDQRLISTRVRTWTLSGGRDSALCTSAGSTPIRRA